jgi:hypothetical protein
VARSVQQDGARIKGEVPKLEHHGRRRDLSLVERPGFLG